MLQRNKKLISIKSCNWTARKRHFNGGREPTVNYWKGNTQHKNKPLDKGCILEKGNTHTSVHYQLILTFTEQPTGPPQEHHPQCTVLADCCCITA